MRVILALQLLLLTLFANAIAIAGDSIDALDKPNVIVRDNNIARAADILKAREAAPVAESTSTYTPPWRGVEGMCAVPGASCGIKDVISPDDIVEVIAYTTGEPEPTTFQKIPIKNREAAPTANPDSPMRSGLICPSNDPAACVNLQAIPILSIG